MISSNRSKLILAVSLAIISNSACRFWSGNDTKNNPDSPVAEIKTNVPFETKELETFQAEIVVSNYIGDKKTKRRYFVAKKGIRNLIVFDYKSEREKANLRTDVNTIYLINRKQKSLKKLSRSEAVESGNELETFLTTKWLNQKVGAEFENLGTTDGLTKYRVKLAESEKTEIFIFIDEKLKTPMRQEFYSVAEDERILNYSIEVKDLKKEVNDDIFAIPSDYSEKESAS